MDKIPIPEILKDLDHRPDETCHGFFWPPAERGRRAIFKNFLAQHVPVDENLTFLCSRWPIDDAFVNQGDQRRVSHIGVMRGAASPRDQGGFANQNEKIAFKFFSASGGIGFDGASIVLLQWGVLINLQVLFVNHRQSFPARVLDFFSGFARRIISGRAVYHKNPDG
ncbi:MAG: hypothetical protein K9G62_01040 [Alphaproteobacteria bacterium]|nr:hypothetical protein [Alphaproteobacteria bacterium]